MLVKYKEIEINFEHSIYQVQFPISNLEILKQDILQLEIGNRIYLGLVYNIDTNEKKCFTNLIGQVINGTLFEVDYLDKINVDNQDIKLSICEENYKESLVDYLLKHDYRW